MFLATTALTDFWDKKRDLLMLGSWCLRHDRRAEWEGLSYEVLPCIWDDRDRLHKAAAEVDLIYEETLPWLGSCLNALHGGPPRSTRYWRIVIGPWLFRFVHSLYDRYLCIKSALERDPNLDTYVLAKENFVTPFDSGEFIKSVLDDFYNLQLFTQVFEALGYAFDSRSLTQSQVGETRAKGFKAALRGIETSIIKCFARHPGQVALCDLYCGRAALWSLVLRSRFKARPIQFSRLGPSRSDLDHSARQALDRFPARDEFTRVLARTLPLAVPRIFIEDFALIKAAVPDPQRRPRVLVTATALHSNEEFKLYAADCMEKGSVLAAAQHGGAYGTFLLQPQEEHEVKTSDVFFTWGWKYESSHQPLPSIHLSRCKVADVDQPNPSAGWLLVTNIVPRYVHRLESVPMAHQFQHYMTWQNRFIKGLGSSQNHLTVRVHPDDFGQGVKERIREAFPQISFDPTGSPARALAGARLVIIDHPVTTMLESLVMNRPTILFWDPQWWEERPEAQYLFKALCEVGVLYYNPDAAADQARAIAGCEEQWWSSNTIQRVRHLALDHYAESSPTWAQSWIRSLLELASQNRR
jgi:putative transferase (TIGR04331 family)